MNGYFGTEPQPNVPPGWDEWYGKISEKNLYFNYTLMEKTGPADTPEIEFYGDQDERVPDRRLPRQGAGVPGRRRPGGDAVHAQPLVQRPPLALRSRPAPPVQPRERRPAEAAGFNEKDISDKPKWLRKQAKRRFKKGFSKTILSERRRRLEQLRSVDEAVGALVAELAQGGPARRHLHRLRLRQRVLPGRAPDRRRQVPGLRALGARCRC